MVTPRDGSYRPFVRHPDHDALLRVRFIEGPAMLAPGESGQVVLELEDDSDDGLISAGTELQMFELTANAVGILTVRRVWRHDARIAS